MALLVASPGSQPASLEAPSWPAEVSVWLIPISELRNKRANDFDLMFPEEPAS